MIGSIRNSFNFENYRRLKRRRKRFLKFASSGKCLFRSQYQAFLKSAKVIFNDSYKQHIYKVSNIERMKMKGKVNRHNEKSRIIKF